MARRLAHASIVRRRIQPTRFVQVADVMLPNGGKHTARFLASCPPIRSPSKPHPRKNSSWIRRAPASKQRAVIANEDEVTLTMRFDN